MMIKPKRPIYYIDIRKAEISKTEGAEIVESKPQRTADQIIQDDRCMIPRELFDKALGLFLLIPGFIITYILAVREKRFSAINQYYILSAVRSQVIRGSIVLRLRIHNPYLMPINLL